MGDWVLGNTGLYQKFGILTTEGRIWVLQRSFSSGEGLLQLREPVWVMLHADPLDRGFLPLRVDGLSCHPNPDEEDNEDDYEFHLLCFFSFLGLGRM